MSSEIQCLKVDDNKNFDEIPLSHSIEITMGFSNDSTLRQSSDEFFFVSFFLTTPTKSHLDGGVI